jgi:hypothetical protein
VKPSYQTAPLTDYSSVLRNRASDLFQQVSQRVGTGRARRYKGSFSIIEDTGQATAAKIMLYEDGKGKINGDDPGLSDGVSLLIRAWGRAKSRTRTIGVAPKHSERFAYFRLAPGQDLEEMADFIVAYADADHR